jgi:hypothetical protein
MYRRRAVFEHRHHRKAPAALAGPGDAKPPDSGGRDESAHSAPGQGGEHSVLGRDLRPLQLE